MHRGAHLDPLKADDSQVKILNLGLIVRKPHPEGVHVPLKQIHKGWPGTQAASVILPLCFSEFLYGPSASQMYWRRTRHDRAQCSRRTASPVSLNQTGTGMIL
jgi:hypothetical protein